jgi:hypothetical protein
MNLKSVIALSVIIGCLPAAMCQPEPIAPGPVAVGGTAQSGGSGALGGSDSGGANAAGGTSSAGGESSTVASIRWLECNTARKAPPTVKRSLSGWRPDKSRAIRARVKPSYRLAAASSFNQPNLETPLDQGSLGSCTGNATAHCLSTWPFGLKLAESDAVRIYSLATTLDPFAGVFPPVDSGSDGRSAALAAKQLGYTTVDFGAVDSIERLQVALLSSSCMIGSSWYAGFSSPSSCGEVGISGANIGGHQYQIIGWDSVRKIFIMRNSWGSSFGVCRDGNPNECGYFYMSAGTVQTLQKRGAEIDCPILG